MTADRQLIVGEKMMTTCNIYNARTRPLEGLYMLYIFQSTHKPPVWQVEKIRIHLGKVMKEKQTQRKPRVIYIQEFSSL